MRISLWEDWEMESSIIIDPPKNAWEGDNIFSKQKIEDQMHDKMHNYL